MPAELDAASLLLVYGPLGIFNVFQAFAIRALYKRMSEQGRLTVHDWDLYDTRHTVFRPSRMTAKELEYGYQWAYREFYKWTSIARGASAHEDLLAGLRHFGYSAGWKKFVLLT